MIDYDEITEVWEASVRSTHHFLTEEDILFYKPLVRNHYLQAVDLYVERNAENRIVAFMGLSETLIEMLFVHPDEQSKGYGKRLLEVAVREKGIRKVDVNEQNECAFQFYKNRGFEVYARDETDAMGKPFPILHLELSKTENSMSINRVRAYFRTCGMEERIMEFDVSSATVPLAALALGCEPARIAKTLSFMVKGRVVLVVMAGDAKIDNAKYKARFEAKAKMLTPEEAVELVGFAVGGVCPFAVNDGVEVYLDDSLKRFKTVFPACGSSNSAIELTINELEKYSSCKGWVGVGKLPD